ncbi:hypothetical protein PT974_10755 [Cladobotryum mycophilum]|uniref:Uncharacterized protein n=1 Tax=Cladobotryum mycophilum TaxID=491253 RepID=A0ABR0SAQ6_9HYPO
MQENITSPPPYEEEVEGVPGTDTDPTPDNKSEADGVNHSMCIPLPILDEMLQVMPYQEVATLALDYRDDDLHSLELDYYCRVKKARSDGESIRKAVRIRFMTIPLETRSICGFLDAISGEMKRAREVRDRIVKASEGETLKMLKLKWDGVISNFWEDVKGLDEEYRAVLSMANVSAWDG